MLAERKNCFPKCKFFRCSKRAIAYHGRTVWCKWTEEDCNVANCSFAICVKRRLLPNGVCGESLKRKTIEREPEEETIVPVKLRGRTLRKIGDRELF